MVSRDTCKFDAGKVNTSSFFQFILSLPSILGYIGWLSSADVHKRLVLTKSREWFATCMVADTGPSGLLTVFRGIFEMFLKLGNDDSMENWEIVNGQELYSMSNAPQKQMSRVTMLSAETVVVSAASGIVRIKNGMDRLLFLSSDKIGRLPSLPTSSGS